MKTSKRTGLFVGVCLLLPLLILAPGWFQWIFPAGSIYTDLTISHYPNLLYLKQNLFETGRLPLWSDAILSGYPFAANPLSGIWYPFTWLLLILPQPFGYTLATSAHLLIGGAGVFFVLRKYGLGLHASTLAAISFELMPKLLGHYSAGHVSLVWAVCFTVWIVYAEQRYREQAGGLWRFAAGVILGIIALADIRWAPYAGILFLSLRIANILYFLSGPSKHDPKERLSIYGRAAGSSLANVIIALGLSAMVWLPLAQFSALSTRSLMTDADRLIYSMPATQLLGLLFPDLNGNWEWMVYMGPLGILALTGVTLQRNRQEDSTFWLWACAAALLWAWGINNPLMHWVSRLPGFDLLRVPSRSLFIFGLAICFLIGFFCDSLFSRQPLGKPARLGLFLLSAFAAALAIAARLANGVWAPNMVWGAVALGVSTAFIFLFSANLKTQISVAFIVLAGILLIDFGALQAINSRYESPESIYDQQNDMVTWLAGQDGLFRVYSPSYSIGQLAAVRNGLQLADGIDPLQLQSYDRFMTQATGVAGDTYSVSIPRFATGRPEKDNEDAIPSAQLLGILNVKYIASAYPMEADGLQYVDQLSGTWIYQNELCRPRAWLQSTTELDESGANIIGYAEEIKYPDANTIQVQVSGDEGYLVLSEVAYPGWRVWIDGQRADLVAIGGLLRGVWIPGGQHTITFVFRPPLVYIGLAVSLAAMMAIVSVVIASTKQAGINV